MTRRNKSKGKVASSVARTFLEGVEACSHPRVSASGKGGLTALGNHSNKIECADSRKLTGSIDIDSALATDPAYAQANRWDYGFGFKESVNAQSEIAVWVEVHTASTSEVSTMIKKRDWLRQYLVDHCETLWNMTVSGSRTVRQFHWIASKDVHILKGSPQARRLAQSGIEWPQKKLKLP